MIQGALEATARTPAERVPHQGVRADLLPILDTAASGLRANFLVYS